MKREAGVGEPGRRRVGHWPGALTGAVPGQCPAFWGAGVPGDGVGDFGHDLGGVEAELHGGPHDLVGGFGGQGGGDPGQLRDLDRVGQVVDEDQLPRPR